jgi:hypothetical protein
MYAFMVGYPIGLDNGDTYLVEVGGKIILLSVPTEVAEWDSIIFFSENDDKKQLYAKLKKKGVCVWAKSAPALFSRLRNFTPFRQGSTVKAKGHFIILIADKKAPVEEIDLEIFRLSNGQRTVNDIYKAIKKKGLLNPNAIIAPNDKSNEHYFLEHLSLLISANVLFLS